MDLKEILINSGLPDEYIPIIHKIDFKKLEYFVSFMVDALISKFKKEQVEYEIDVADPNSSVCGIITHIIEVGGIKIVCDNHIETDELKELQKITTIVSLSMNIVLALEFKKKGLINLNSEVYFNTEALEIIIDRLVTHVLAGQPGSHAHFEFFSNDMVKTYLFNKL